jgi:hypothetical protein
MHNTHFVGEAPVQGIGSHEIIIYSVVEEVGHFEILGLFISVSGSGLILVCLIHDWWYTKSPSF